VWSWRRLPVKDISPYNARELDGWNAQPNSAKSSLVRDYLD